MNNSENDTELKALLDRIEYAGREQRRDEVLSQMLDRLAAAEAGAAPAPRFTLRRSLPYVAAACVLLAVGLVLRLGLNGGGGELVAGGQAPVVVPVDTPQVSDRGEEQQLPDEAPAVSRPVKTKRQVDSKAVVPAIELAASQVADAAGEESEPAVEEEWAPEMSFATEDYLAEQPVPDTTGAVESYPVEDVAQPIVSVCNAETMAGGEARPKRFFEVLLSNLFRSKPSKMEGTMLAFRLM